MYKRQKDLTKNILITLGVIGTISAVAVAPGLAKILPLLERIDTARINQAIKRLQKRGMVEIIKKNSGVQEIKLTLEGKKRLALYKLDDLEIAKPPKWDGRWRIIIFDIPISKNSSREKLRRKIKDLGFFQLQASVFVHPYPCYDVVEFIRQSFGVKSEVEYLEVVKLENQNKLITHFFT